jgi:hypothetical protein
VKKPRYCAKFINTKNPFIYNKEAILMKVFEKVVKLCMKLTVREETSRFRPQKNPKAFPEKFQKLLKLVPMIGDL